MLRASERIALIRTLDQKYFDVSEVLQATGVTRKTLRLWRENDVQQIKPSAKLLHKGHWIYLWDENALRSTVEYAKKRTRKALLFTPEERRARHNAQTGAVYHERRAREVEDRDQKAEHERIARELRAQLAQERDQRACWRGEERRSA